ncbi:MAG: adenylate kinase [Thermoanaerobaculia bacterium]
MAETRLVFLGAPGSGKGTQAERLSGRLGVPTVSTGEMLRSAVAVQNDLGRRVAEIMGSGDLVDDATMEAVVAERLDREDARAGFILDGYPRTLVQAAALEGILADRDEELDAVILIEVPEAELVRRALARQREDDTEEVIRTRLEVYREKTEPLVRHYAELGLLHRIDGHRSIDEVTEAIGTVLAVEV